MIRGFVALILVVCVAVPLAVAQTGNDLNEGSSVSHDSYNDTFTLSWWGQVGRTYFLQRSEDLVIWHYIPIIEPGADAPIEWGFTTEDAARLFLRLHHSDIPTSDPFGADFDGDKVRNFNEVWNDTNPLEMVDKEPDGMADDWEWFFFQSLSRDGSGDFDQDGISDAAEYAAGSDPSDFFNGAAPQVILISGNNQSALAGGFLTEPLVVEVRNSSGTPIANAPVSFFVSQGAGMLFQSQSGAGAARMEIRTDSNGRAQLLFRLPFAGDLISKIRAGALSRFNGYGLVEFTALAENSAEKWSSVGLKSWLKADSITGSLGSAVPTWSDLSGNGKNAAQVSGSSSGTLPTLVEDGVKAVSFDGSNDRLTFGSGIGQNDFTVVALYKPEATRTTHSPATNYASRNAGTTGQRYLLAGVAGSGGNIWPAPLPATPTAKLYSTWKQKEFDIYKNYNFDPLPNNRWRSDALKRYDDTDSQFHRLNSDGDGNGPGTNQDRSDSYWQDRFEDYIGSGSFQNWTTEHVKVKDNHQKTYQYLGQTKVVWEEDYYEYRAKTYQLPYLQDSSQPVTSVGNVGAGLSVGTNAIGAYELRSDYNPNKFNANDAATAWQVGTVRYAAKRPKVYAQGVYLGEGAASQAANVTGPAYLGGGSDNSNFFKGKIAELLIFDRTLGEDEQAGVEDYLAERAGVTILDRDNDGLPDFWEIDRFGDLDETAAGNPDGDGFTNTQELDYQTNPLNRDTDQDGLTDDVEVNTTETNPLLADTDGDGYPDGYEVAHPPLDPLNAADGLADADGNGIPDGWDFVDRFDRDTTDSDGDGLLDWQEIAIGSDPYGSADSNGDGISDRNAWLSGVNAFNLDHDGDGISNSDELIRGTDPFLADSDGDGVNDSADAYPRDPTRSQLLTGDPSDVTPPVVLVERPPDAQLIAP